MATITDMGIPGGFGGGIQQPLYKNRWRINMFLREAGNDGIKGITSMAITAERPKLEYEEIQLDRYNSRAFLQGKYTFQPITIVIEPDMGGRCHRGLQRQHEVQQKLIGPDNGIFLGQAEAGEDYKFYTQMDLLNGSHPNAGGPEVILERWHLEGCAINNIDFGDLDYQASETVKTTMTLRYDHAYLEVSGSLKKATGGVAGSR